METIESLQDRLRLDPISHIGRKSVHLIHAYELGYQLGRQRWAKPLLKVELNGHAFQNWAEHRFGWTAEMGCRQDVVSFSLLISVDEQSAFDTYFDLRDAARRDLGMVVDTEAESHPLPAEGLITFIANEHFRSRPGLYLGSASVDALWALCSGFVWAEKDVEVRDSDAQTFLVGFQRWMEERYPFATARPWNRILSFLTLGSPDRAWASFFEVLDMFRAGRSPKSFSKTGERMLEGITREILANEPAREITEVSATLREVVKGITPV
ncbi:MAG: hypothetical protein ACHRHE_11005 [Tepidisphaerales bacterium]